MTNCRQPDARFPAAGRNGRRRDAVHADEREQQTGIHGQRDVAQQRFEPHAASMHRPRFSRPSSSLRRLQKCAS